MYVHRRCKPSKAELDIERTVHGYCGICGNQGTIYLVEGTEDAYRHKRQGVTYTVRAVGTLTDEEVAITKSKTNITDTVIIEEITPSEVPVEPELTEETEALEEAVEESLDAIIEEVGELDIPPEEMDVEPKLGPSEKEPEETPLEAEPEASIESVEETLDILKDGSYDDLLPPETDKNATIARLEAELERLRK